MTTAARPRPDMLSTNPQLAGIWRLWLASAGMPANTRPYPATWKAFLQQHYGAPAAPTVPPEPASAAPTTEGVPVTALPVASAVDPSALFRMFGDLMEQAGWQPHAVSNGNTPINETAARALVHHIIDEHLASGKLRTTVHVQVNDTAPRQVSSTPPVWFPRALKLALARVNILLVGPAGCGKSYGAKLLAEQLGLPFYPLSLSAGVDEGVLSGWLLPLVRARQQGDVCQICTAPPQPGQPCCTDCLALTHYERQMLRATLAAADAGTFLYIASMFVHAYEHGGVVLIDEIDASDPNPLLILNAALDRSGIWSVPQRHQHPILTRHPDFVCVAAANTHGHGISRQYVGRNQLDEATLSRFRLGQIVLDFDTAMEQALYGKTVVLYGQRLRARCRAQAGWTRDVSTRDIDTADVLVRSGMAVEEAWYGYFADWSPEELTRVDAELLDGTRALLR